jgi:hypothetical protein
MTEDKRGITQYMLLLCIKLNSQAERMIQMGEFILKANLVPKETGYSDCLEPPALIQLKYLWIHKYYLLQSKTQP